MTASLKLDGITGRMSDLQEDLKSGFEDALSDGDDFQRTINVTIDRQTYVDSTSRRIRGRRGLQEGVCSIDLGDACDVEATATVTFLTEVDGGSGESSALGVDSLSVKENFEKIGSSVGVEASDVTMDSLKVSADPDSIVEDGDENFGVVGQTTTSSSNAGAENYWLFIVACVLLLLLWLCCVGWGWQRYRNAMDESEADESPRISRWGGESYRDPPSPTKGLHGVEGGKMDALMQDVMDEKRKEKSKSTEGSGGGADSQVGVRTSLEDIPEESGSSAGDPNSRGSGGNRVRVVAEDSGVRSSWEDESWEANRDSLRQARAVPSGRQVLSRGKQRSTGSSSFSDELVAQRGPESSRRNVYDRMSDVFTSEELDQRNSNTSYTSNTSGGVSGSGISSSFTSSAGVTSSTFDDEDDDDSDEGSSDYEDAASAASDAARRAELGDSAEVISSFADHGAGIPEMSHPVSETPLVDNETPATAAY